MTSAQACGAFTDPSSSDDATPAWLFSRGIAGNEERFCRQYRPLVKTWAGRELAKAGWLGRLDPDDFAQDVLLRVLRRFGTEPFVSERESGGFRAYLRQCVRHAVVDALRTARATVRGIQLAPDVWEALQESADELADGFDSAWQESLVQLRAALTRVRRRVGPVRWQAFHLFVVEQRKGAEVAARLGLTPAQVYDAKYDIQVFLREELAEGGAGG